MSDSASTEPVAMTLERARKIFPPMWIVYDSPLDFPGEAVARVWYGMVPEPDVIRARDLMRLRELIVEAGASECLKRSDGDDPCIREVWL